MGPLGAVRGVRPRAATLAMALARVLDAPGVVEVGVDAVAAWCWGVW